ncbi:hypothetical protein GCM10009122_16280 [Fulvivirga kasyanovii]|uniref:DUF3857 domain-containing protein n=1 Tax=Fulvivirga kasyanovii TaxID=396812 RepID=A0ABW9RVP5_9BACT|nr:DUF3857 domain-containing protein [Fulvivirga kasyanovii]MTI28277.1 DUF3857 domain-containing protein [Fulvivirga kasyanovii]
MMSKLFLRKYKIHLLILGFGLLTGQALSQDVLNRNIPDSIKQNAKAIVISDEARFQVHSLRKTVLHRRTVITILNPQAANLGIKGINYDKSSSIVSFKAKCYDEHGKEIEDLKKSEFLDRSNISEVSLFEDNRVRIADLRRKVYPYTVEFEYEVEYKNLFQTPNWVVQPDEKIGVLKSSFEMAGPGELIPFYEVHNAPEPVKETSGTEVSLKWQFEHLKPVQFEPFGTNITFYTPVIYTTPHRFEYDGYPGEFTNWSNFGKWIKSLNTNRDQLPEATISKIKALVADAQTEKEKVKRIYSYLQQNTRYVSVQLGIGGFQPIEAITVDNVGYGDCKALSNYTKAMLKAAGIKSNYVLVEAGQYPRPLKKGFANSTFNHAILAVPMKNDTIWLECTSQTNPFGYLGKFTSDREVLLITEEGGVVVRTPAYQPEQNQQITVARVSIDDEGTGTVDMAVSYKGIQIENGNLDYYLRQGHEEQEKWIYRNSDISSFNLLDFKFELIEKDLPEIQQKSSLEIKKLASISGKRLFIRPNLNNKSTYIPEVLEQRKTPIVKQFSYYDTDSIIYTLPIGYVPEFVPEPLILESSFGKYTSQITIDGTRLIYTRTLLMEKGTYSKDIYEELISFYKKIARSDKQKVVMINKT